MSDCHVCISSYDGEQATFYQERIVKARKPHTCYECRETIPIGARYEYVCGRWDDFAHYHFCLTCAEIGTALTCDGGRLFGQLWEDIHDYVFPEMNQACLDKLTTVAAKTVLTERWKRWKRL